MDSPFVVLPVIIATIAVLCAGLVFSVRRLKANAALAAADGDGGDQRADAGHSAILRRDHATTELLKRFFDGKECAICKRPIPTVQRTGLKPGLLNPRTHEAYSWDEIPNAEVSSALETSLPLCPECRVAESFRHRFPDRVVDRAH